MKKFIAMTAAIVLSAAVLEAHAEEELTSCEDISSLAGTVMENRQYGVSMSAQMRAADGSEMVEAIIIEAYEIPSFSTEEYKNRQIREFSDNWYLGCEKSRR